VVGLSKVYILIETWDYADDGFNIKGVFATLKALRDYVAINHAEFTLDDDGDYFYKDEEFEYSVFGSPKQKIGNFTQQKLTSFGGVPNA
jgi:succinylglutamate desuccinylase